MLKVRLFTYSLAPVAFTNPILVEYVLVPVKLTTVKLVPVALLKVRLLTYSLAPVAFTKPILVE